jgi:ribose transport system permease protein
MLGALLLLSLFFSALTIEEQHPGGASAAREVAAKLQQKPIEKNGVIIVAGGGGEDRAFVESLQSRLRQLGWKSMAVIFSDPAAMRRQLDSLAATDQAYRWIATVQTARPIVANIAGQIPALASAEIILPNSYHWPTFLLPENLRNVANQITVIAIIAIGMTMVIITAGIDLSVGSLLALSAVLTAWLIERWGGEAAASPALFAASAAAIIICGLVGAFSGLMITRFRIPPFIATLAMMQVAAGLAYIISRGLPIYHVPARFVTLGRGSEPLLGIPYAVILMALLYLMAHILMSRTTLGRYIYAVGGNEEAARLAGIRVKRILLFVYVLCGMLAGLGGVIMTSQLKSGAPTYGVTYELYIIAAVVVGGTSLSGGEGRILSTLIGAFIIAVIQNGMNLTNVESYTQKVVLGLVILAAVLLDRIKQQKLAGK